MHKTEENVGRHLQQKIGVSNGVKDQIIKLIFGAGGLLHCEDEVDFDLNTLELSETIASSCPEFGPYFGNLVPTLKSKVFIPNLQNKDKEAKSGAKFKRQPDHIVESAR